MKEQQTGSLSFIFVTLLVIISIFGLLLYTVSLVDPEFQKKHPAKEKDATHH